VTSTAELGRPRRWPAVLAWALWALAMLGLAVVPWTDRLTIRAGRADLTGWQGPLFVAVLGHLTATTVGAVLASRRPRHPVGWLLLGFALALTASGVIAHYVAYGLLARPGALPAAHALARYYRATGPAALALLSFVLLLTPTGSLPSPRWRWWAVVTAATPVALLVVRFHRARGIERQQLGWVALAAALMVLAAPVVLVPVALGIPILVDWAAAVWAAALPVAVGAAILRYRLYDLDRIVSRTLVYGLLTLLLGGGYALVVLGLGQLLGRESPLVVAAATLAVAALFSRPAAGSRPWSIGGSTGAAMTRPGSSRGSVSACATRSTSTP
jgi:hypothetical protein